MRQSYGHVSALCAAALEVLLSLDGFEIQKLNILKPLPGFINKYNVNGFSILWEIFQQIIDFSFNKS